MNLPSHLFVSSMDGALHDTREKDWSSHPLRERYAYHARRIDSGLRGTAQVRAALRAGAYAWPGGYALYFVTHDGETLSFVSVRENLRRVLDSVLHGDDDGWRVIGIETTETDEEPVHCAHSGKEIS